MRKILIIDLHCDALLPAGVGEFGGGNTYSKAVISSIIDTDIVCLYITRKKVKNLNTMEKIGSNITYLRIEIGQTAVEDKDTLYKYKDEIFDKTQNILQEYDFIPDIIHSMYWSSGIIALHLSVYYNIPFIHTVLSNGKRKLIQSGKYDISDIRIKYEEECFKNAKFIICSSKYELEDIAQLYNVSPEKLILSGLKVDTTFKSPPHDRLGNYKLNSFTGEDNYYLSIDKASHEEPSLWWNNGAFLYYGRLHPDKGIIQIVNSWLELKMQYPDFPMLWIAGGTPEQIYRIRKNFLLEDKLKYFENTQDIIWWGRLNSEGLSTLLTKSLALVTHSRYESGGLMILESLAQGVPVIATPFGYAHDYIRDWENGFIIKYDDCVQLKRRMLHFYHQPFLSSVLGNMAKELYEKLEKEFNFSYKHMQLYHGKCPKKVKSKQHLSNNQCLTYPITELFPTDKEILSYFKQNISNNSWESVGIPILKRSTDYGQYHIWIISYQDKEYECFKWKTHINTERIFVPKGEYFVLGNKMASIDCSFYENQICPHPINTPTESQVTIFPICYKEHNYVEIEKNLDILFNSKEKIKSNIFSIDFHKILNDLQETMYFYQYNFQGILFEVFSILNKSNLDYEPQGILPYMITKHTLLDNNFVHLGQICIGPKSFFYAMYLLEAEGCSTERIKHFIKESLSKTQSQKNILLWLLCLKFQDIIEKLILYNKISESDLFELIEFKKILEQYN